MSFGCRSRRSGVAQGPPLRAPMSMVAGPRLGELRLRGPVATPSAERSSLARVPRAPSRAEPLRSAHALRNRHLGAPHPAARAAPRLRAKRLPEMGRQLGKGMREFKDSVSGKRRRRQVDEVAELPPARARRAVDDRDARARARHRLLSPPRAMARRIVPRRLSHDEEATLVEHLTELRHRLFICIVAIVPAFALAYAFHDELIEPAHGPAPRGDADRHARRDRAVHHVAQGELLRRDRARPADRPLADLGVPRAGGRATDTQRVLGVFVVLATVLFVAGRRVLLRDRAARGRSRSSSTTTPTSTRSRSARATSSPSSR